MAPRRARENAPINADSSDDDDGGYDENEATPRPAHKKSGRAKKRISDVYSPNGGGSSSPAARVPLKSRNVNFNDDEAEKRMRRKSMKLVAQATLMSEEGQEALDQGVEAAAGAGPSSQSIVQDFNTTPRRNRTSQRFQLATVTEAPVINIPMDVMSSNFEEWMKMATDNKINAANSWNFALIDYFHDMKLLRNNADNSINFQKASCTLDGCVKIWTSRVDSVGTETGKLLSNLASEGKNDDDEEAESDNPDADPTQKTKRAKANRPAGSTLAKDAAQLRTKKLDLEFEVDPLFRKTCADFDEGGAQGLLMNHLSLGIGPEANLRIIFDASDAMWKEGDDEEEILEPEELIDLSYLRQQFLPDLDALERKSIAPSLADFSFGKDAFSVNKSTAMNATYVDDNHDDDDDDFGGPAPDVPMDVDTGADGPRAVEDFFGGDLGDDYGGMDVGGDNDGGFGQGDVADGDDARSGAFEPMDPRRIPNEHDLVMAMTEAGAAGSSLDYFDQSFLKNWAGPEHWKLRKVIRRPDVSADTTGPKPRREKKEAFKIDFLTPSEKSQKEISKEIFAPVTKGGSINLPGAASKSASNKKTKGRKAKEAVKRVEQTLPDDMHFSSRQLVTLFLKPQFALKMRGHRMRNAPDGDIDENFWAQAANQNTANADGDADETADGGAIPFNTQFFHDDYDDVAGFDDVYDGDDAPVPIGDDSVSLEPGEQDLLAATQGQVRRVRPEHVNYAKRAKRVDVRKLKDNIWKGLDIVVPPPVEEGREETPSVISARPPTDPEEGRVFTSVIQNLQRTYPKDKMQEISTSFCFICLLHLANEQGLKLDVGEGDNLDANARGMSMQVDDEDDDVGSANVGNIWGLKVYRDPEATPAA